MEITIKKYWLDISNELEAQEHQQLCKKLKARGLKCFNVWAMDSKREEIDGTFELETDYLFDNQFNAGDYRLFDWYEGIYPNKDIKCGHYVVDCPGFDYLQKLRNETKRCGYCGKQYTDHRNWCIACLDSEYLKKDQLKLLKTYYINQKPVYQKPPKWLVKEYDIRQKAARIARLERDKQHTLDFLKKDIESAQKEYEGFKLIIEAGLDYKNCIYYNHIDQFCFGWRTPLTEAEKIEIGEKLKKFPFDYDMK